MFFRPLSLWWTHTRRALACIVSDNFKELFGATFSSSLVVDGLKQIAGKTVELGKQAVQFSAEGNASNAQFEQTFKGVEETARATLKSISKQVGITETRMQDGYARLWAVLCTPSGRA